MCGTTDNLEFDHIDPSTKTFVISQNINAAWDKMKLELDKCQLLCRKHHREKTNASVAKPIVHGTAFAYRKHKCRCDECKAYNSKTWKNWYANRLDNLN